MKVFIEIYLMLKILLFIFCAFIFLPLSFINASWYTSGVTSFCLKFIEELRENDLISELKAEELKKNVL